MIAEAVSAGRINFEKIRGFISEEDHLRYSAKYRPQRGDIFMVKSGATTGVTAIVETDADFNIWSPLAVVRCGEAADPYFVLNFMRSKNFMEAITLGWSFGTQQNIGMGVIENLAIPAPSVVEQRAIAAFLTAETAKIDALVEEQQRLIELLKEKRQAVISQAVTKGLDPNVPMKDSGVDWLGTVPAHWQISRLKHATSHIIDCPHETPAYSADGEFTVIRTADLSDGRLNLSNAYRLDEAEYKQRTRRASLHANDIVYGREGERWGHAALVPESPICCLGQRMMQFRCNDEFVAAFLMWSLNSETVYRQGQVDTVGATSPHVNVETIRNYVLCQPPRAEQTLIARVLTDACESVDALVAEAESVSTLLRERRSALISAAVTGKIDVRGLAS